MTMPDPSLPVGAVAGAGDSAADPRLLADDSTRRSTRAAAVTENVGKGLALASLAIVAGAAVAILLWKAHFIASISSALIGLLAVRLYEKGAGASPRRGLYPLAGLIVVGVVISFFAVVAADLVDVYSAPLGQALGYSSVVDFVVSNIARPQVLGTYGKEIAFFALFGALGIYRTVGRLIVVGRAHRQAV